jgi:hypothetical protein
LIIELIFLHFARVGNGNKLNDLKKEVTMRKLFLPLILILLISNLGLSTTLNKTKFGAGLQNTPPQGGISGIYNHSQKISFQCVIGSSIGGRFIYRFYRQDNYNLYGYGGFSLGLYYYHDNYYYDYYDPDPGTRLGLDGGCGIEYNLKSISNDLPSIYTTMELGINISRFYFPVALGLGFHYYFDLSE